MTCPAILGMQSQVSYFATFLPLQKVFIRLIDRYFRLAWGWSTLAGMAEMGLGTRLGSPGVRRRHIVNSKATKRL